MDSSWLSVASVGKILDLTPTRVRQIARAGALPCTMTQVGRLFSPEDVEAFRAQRESNRARTRRSANLSGAIR
jgi:hypothetical protein